MDTLDKHIRNQPELPLFLVERISGAKGLPAASGGGALKPLGDTPPPG